MFVAVPVVGAAGAAGAYLYNKVYGEAGEEQDASAPSAAKPRPDLHEDETPEEVEEVEEAYPVAESVRTEDGRRTWKESSGRSYGSEGYVFGDVARGVFARNFYASGKERQAAEEEGDTRFSQAQMLVRDAVELYRARGYTGNISFSHTVGYFSESASVRVEGSQRLLKSTDGAISPAFQLTEHSKAGRVFATLINRLERRAQNWEAISGMEGIDPVLSASATIGFKVPLISVGWGLSISLTITHSSLLRWAQRQIEDGDGPSPGLPALDNSPARPALNWSQGDTAAADAATDDAIHEAQGAFHH